MQRRYRDGNVPWDHALPPPEVRALTSHLPPGRALDLGCGGGRAAIFLAQHGWHCDAVDWVPEAIVLATERARAAGVAERIRFHTASVTSLKFLDDPFDLALDVGCMHALWGAPLYAYAHEVTRLVRRGGRYLLFARLTDEPAPHGRGVPEQVIHDVFAQHWTFNRIEHGLTNPGEAAWASAWFWLTRT